jgi:hypothetical protein
VKFRRWQWTPSDDDAPPSFWRFVWLLDKDEYLERFSTLPQEWKDTFLHFSDTVQTETRRQCTQSTMKYARLWTRRCFEPLSKSTVALYLVSFNTSPLLNTHSKHSIKFLATFQTVPLFSTVDAGRGDQRFCWVSCILAMSLLGSIAAWLDCHETLNFDMETNISQQVRSIMTRIWTTIPAVFMMATFPRPCNKQHPMYF